MQAAALSTDVFTAAYDLLARAYLGGPRAVTAVGLPALSALRSALAATCRLGLPTGLALGQDAAFPGRADAAEREFFARLVTPVPGRYVPPYASVYLDSSGRLWGPSTFKVLSWYQEEGLDWDGARPGPGGSRILAPDHVGVEMAFLAVVSARASSGQLGSATLSCLRAVLSHLVAWLPRFHAALAQADATRPGRLSPGAGITHWTALAVQLVGADLRSQRQRGQTGGYGHNDPLVRSGR